VVELVEGGEGEGDGGLKGGYAHWILSIAFCVSRMAHSRQFVAKYSNDRP